MLDLVGSLSSSAFKVLKTRVVLWGRVVSSPPSSQVSTAYLPQQAIPFSSTHYSPSNRAESCYCSRVNRGQSLTESGAIAIFENLPPLPTSINSPLLSQFLPSSLLHLSPTFHTNFLEWPQLSPKGNHQQVDPSLLPPSSFLHPPTRGISTLDSFC